MHQAGFHVNLKLDIGMAGYLRLRVGVLNSLKIVEKAKQEASQEVAY